MLKSKAPSPSLVVACLALAIALGGTAYAASLPKNSVGSPQVKPNSLKGVDIKESTLAGVLLAKGNAQARARILPPLTGFTTLLTIPKVGRLEADCGSGSSAQMRFVNTTSSGGFMWVRKQGILAGLTLLSHGNGAVSVGALDFVDVIVRSSSPNRVTVIHAAVSISGGLSCSYTAIGESVARP